MDLNHDKPVCLGVTELRTESMGMESCSLYDIRGQMKNDESDLENVGRVIHRVQH